MGRSGDETQPAYSAMLPLRTWWDELARVEALVAVLAAILSAGYGQDCSVLGGAESAPAQEEGAGSLQHFL